MFKRNAAFTLAEVLITLGIIGIVAEMTIPTLMNNVETQIFKTAYKKAYSDINQAFKLSQLDDKFIDTNNNLANAQTNLNALRDYFKSVKSCNESVAEGCWIDSCVSDADCISATPGENSQARSVGFIDASGRFWAHYKPAPYTTIMVDINGSKKPNRIGRDRFFFSLEDDNGLQNGLAPTKISVWGDIIPKSSPSPCSMGNCYFSSWLFK